MEPYSLKSLEFPHIDTNKHTHTHTHPMVLPHCSAFRCNFELQTITDSGLGSRVEWTHCLQKNTAGNVLINHFARIRVIETATTDG